MAYDLDYYGVEKWTDLASLAIAALRDPDASPTEKYLAAQNIEDIAAKLDQLLASQKASTLLATDREGQS